MRPTSILALFGLLVCGGNAAAQTAGVLYTWAGTGNEHEWVGGDSDNGATVTNTIAGQLTVVETGDPIEPFDPGLAHVIRDGFNRRLESSTSQGGLDLYGLEAIEVDLSHNGSGPINLQFFLQARPEFDYVWAGNDGTPSGPDFNLAPGVLHTLRFPLSILTPAQQAYIRTVGLSVRAHEAQGNVTWNVFEVRSTGASATVRDLAPHDVGSLDNGLNGAFVNFERTAVVGNNGGQNQTGLSFNAAGTGSLRWTDRGNAGVPANPSGAAVSWVNGTVFEGNGFNERLADLSNYDTLTFRMSATDPLNAGGTLGVQGFFQTGEFNTPTFQFQVPSGIGVGPSGEILLPIDGQFHELVFPLASITDRLNVLAFGMNLFAHANDLVIDVDFVRFNEVDQLDGDFNLDDKVDAADYVVWRKANGSAEEYSLWQQHFGEMAMPGGGGVVPEPATIMMLVCLIVGIFSRDRQRK